MRPISALSIILLLMLGAIEPVGAAGEMEFIFGCKSTRLCTIRENPGGIPVMYERAAREALRLHTKIRIDGPCASACVIFAGRVRRQTCTTKNARMKIHRGSYTTVYEPFGRQVDISTEGGLIAFLDPPPGYRTETTHFTPDYGADITAWALRENKLPYEGMYTLTREEAVRYWRPCSK